MITEEQLAEDREPIPYIPVKQLRRDRPLYVMKQTRPHPIRGYGNSRDEFSVVDIRGYRKGYEPRLDILGQYTPNPHDLFRLGTGRLPPYQPTATGDKLQAEMERLQVHKAWRINPIARGNPMPEEVPVKGACYRDAWRFQVKQEEGILVHGEVTGADGVTRKHAWVELPTGFIYEPQTAKFFKADVFKRAFNPKEDARYTVEEALVMLGKKNYHGAWAEEMPAVGEVAKIVEISKGTYEIRIGDKKVADLVDQGAGWDMGTTRRTGKQVEIHNYRLFPTEEAFAQGVSGATGIETPQEGLELYNYKAGIVPPTPEVPAVGEVAPKSKVFYTTTTDMPLYDQLLDPTKAEYFAREKGEKGTVIWVTPDEALAKGAKIHGVSVEEELRGVNEEAISKYTNIMKQGEKFPMPVLDYKRGDQEGRHRILAAKKAGETNIPVLIVEEVTPPTPAVGEVAPEVTGNWRQAFDDTKDLSRKADILRAVADSDKVTPKELTDILDRVTGLPEEANIRWAVEHRLKQVSPKPPAVEVPAVPEITAIMKDQLAEAMFEASEGKGYFRDAAGFRRNIEGWTEADIKEAYDLYVRVGKIKPEARPPAKPPAVEEVKEGSNPMGKVITKEEAIGLLERLSMTPGEAARSLVADEAERRELIQTVQQRVQREQNKWAPMDPRTGPPLPRVFAGLRWPWKK